MILPFGRILLRFVDGGRGSILIDEYEILVQIRRYLLCQLHLVYSVVVQTDMESDEQRDECDRKQGGDYLIWSKSNRP
ncbi:hypothetical protein U1Q18_050014, partial [Sarracenia purpurea var. burkii]